MGFLMKKLLLISIFFTLVAGCSTSYIKVPIPKSEKSYDMFGKTGKREFYIEQSIGDSLIKKWEAETNGSFPNSSVTVYDSLIFINDLSGRVYCIGLNTGKTLGQLKNKGAVYTTPVINNSTIIFAVAQEDKNLSILFYYDYMSGKTLFEIEIPGRVLTELIKNEDGIIFNTEKGIVYKYSMKGEKIWEYDTKSMTHSSPAINKNIVVFGNDSGEIIGINAIKGTLIYKEKIGESFFCGTAIDDHTAYIGNDNGYIYALELTKGKVKWKFDTGARITMTPALNKENLLVGNLKGALFSLRKSDSRLNWQINTDGVLNASPLITDNMAIVPDLNEKFYLVKLETGEIIDYYYTDGRVKLSPVIYNNHLFIGYDDGVLSAYEIVN
jgi:outer membrane protein assembly factor BamB